jgi:hypothetical protein
MPLNRRHFLWSVLGAPALAASKKQPPLERPNILIVTADGLGAYMLGCYANTEIRTPNIDRLSQTGVRFTNAFASTPTVPEPGPHDAALSDALAGAGYNVNSGNGSGAEFLDAQTPAKPFFLTLTWPSPASVTVAQKDVDQYAKTSFEAMGWEPAAPNATHKEMLKDVPGNLTGRAVRQTATAQPLGKHPRHFHQQPWFSSRPSRPVGRWHGLRPGQHV